MKNIVSDMHESFHEYFSRILYVDETTFLSVNVKKKIGLTNKRFCFEENIVHFCFSFIFMKNTVMTE